MKERDGSTTTSKFPHVYISPAHSLAMLNFVFGPSRARSLSAFLDYLSVCLEAFGDLARYRIVIAAGRAQCPSIFQQLHRNLSCPKSPLVDYLPIQGPYNDPCWIAFTAVMALISVGSSFKSYDKPWNR